METVRFTTYDGIELAANLYLPEKLTGEWSPGIIVCHGFASCKENHADFAEIATGQGFAVLIPDLRGHGESGGEVDANIFNDVAAALQYIQTRPEVNPASIALRGSSMGGWLAVHTGAHLKDISPVIAYCPVNEALMLVTMEEMGIVQRGHKSPVIPDNPPRVNVNSMIQLLYRLDVGKSARRIHPRPLLLVHSEGDEVVPPHISETIYKTAEEPKTLWLLPGGDHRSAAHDPETNKRALEWLIMNRSTTETLTMEKLPEG
ncbi:MAG TPA: alpha/beta hydrolase [Chloroflexia bacterium]|nr:alpha/beta hydrolase [Chloroflexia bacterium]